MNLDQSMCPQVFYDAHKCPNGISKPYACCCFRLQVAQNQNQISGLHAGQLPVLARKASASRHVPSKSDPGAPREARRFKVVLFCCKISPCTF
ncbi:hypothetical protein HanRHA438_Chr04g0180031 [Helianthus annuus]|nr:hypothetical protein HanRHA438_Chr04g0180031 [Helianthus annuus]